MVDERDIEMAKEMERVKPSEKIYPDIELREINGKLDRIIVLLKMIETNQT